MSQELKLPTTAHQGKRADEYRMMKQGRALFMVEPSAFDVVQAINPHMRDDQGKLHAIDKKKAQFQWEQVRDQYLKLGVKLKVLEGLSNCPDMVFCANQSFPFFDAEGKRALLLSNMADPTRHQEVASIGSQTSALGIKLYQLPARSPETYFEAMGDALWVPGRELILGGFGSRTRREIYRWVQEITRTPILLFELANPRFYHLDTCLSVIDAQCALACRAGFTEEGWQTLQVLFPKLIEVPLEEADSPQFACNAHSPDRRHVLLQKGSSQTVKALEQAGYLPVEVDTGEFIKSGGSVFCMKLQTVWDHWDEA